jgi:hypothetical protein
LPQSKKTILENLKRIIIVKLNSRLDEKYSYINLNKIEAGLMEFIRRVLKKREARDKLVGINDYETLAMMVNKEDIESMSSYIKNVTSPITWEKVEGNTDFEKAIRISKIR